jgi:hypothetical protein
MAHEHHTGFWSEVTSGLQRLLGGGWPPTDRPFAVLLDVLVRGSKLQDDLHVREVEASAVSTRELDEEEGRLAREELDAARADLPEFEAALVDAWKRSGGSDAEVPYDSADPSQDRAADALIRYLVTTRTASVRTVEQDTSYVYHVSVNWDTLDTLAQHFDVDIRAALRDAASETR